MTTPALLDFLEGTDPGYSPASGRLLLWPNSADGKWYARNSTGVDTALSGVTGVTAAAGNSIVVGGTATAPTIARAALTGDATAAADSNAITFATVNASPGTTGDASHSSAVTTNSKGLVTTNSSVLITPAAIGAAVVGRLISTSAPLTGGGDLSADRTLGISAASASAAGSFAAADYGHLASGWIDVTRQGANSMSTGASQAANTTAIGNIMSAAPSGSVLYFPPGWYPINPFQIPAKVFIFQGSGAGLNGALSAFTTTTDLAADWITQTAATSYMRFRDMGFIAQHSQSAGACVNVSGNASNKLVDCEFTGLSNTQTLHDCITFGGSNGGEESVIDSCDFTNFTGTAVNCNCNLSTLVFDKCTINGGLTTTTGAACGINITLGGAVQIVNSDIIGCTNNLLINPATTPVASVWATNTYFDNSFGSCVKITGAGATVRCKFEECSFTVAANASPANAVEVSSTFSYGAVGMGLDFINCNVLNTFGTLGSGTGFNITGAADFRIADCNIAAWAVGIDVTAAASSITRPTIQDNTIGNAGGYGVNTIGIRLNAGVYGSQVITGNNCLGNTTPLTDNTTVTTTASNNRIIQNNLGINPKSVVAQPAVPATTVAVWNSTGVDCTVYIKDATPANLTAITIGGVAISSLASSATNAIPVRVAANQQIAMTFTTAPTWVWVGS